MKPLEEYHRFHRTADGRVQKCKVCVLAYQAEYRKRPEVAERASEYERVQRRQGELAERRREANKRFRERPEAKERARVRDKELRKANIERHRAYMRIVRAARRAMKKNAPRNDLTSGEWAEIRQAYDHRCVYCGESGQMTMDHVQPLSRGGSHTASNIVPACLTCNARKHARPAPPHHQSMRMFTHPYPA